MTCERMEDGASIGGQGVKTGAGGRALGETGGVCHQLLELGATGPSPRKMAAVGWHLSAST